MSYKKRTAALAAFSCHLSLSPRASCSSFLFLSFVAFMLAPVAQLASPLRFRKRFVPPPLCSVRCLLHSLTLFSAFPLDPFSFAFSFAALFVHLPFSACFGLISSHISYISSIFSVLSLPVFHPTLSPYFPPLSPLLFCSLLYSRTAFPFTLFFLFIICCTVRPSSIFAMLSTFYPHIPFLPYSPYCLYLFSFLLFPHFLIILLSLLSSLLLLSSSLPSSSSPPTGDAPLLNIHSLLGGLSKGAARPHTEKQTGDRDGE